MELLVSMTLVSFLSVGMLFAMRIGLNSMQKADSKLMENRTIMGLDKIFAAQVAGFMPAKIDCRPRPDLPLATLVFFEGDPDGMRFVSTYSLGDGARGYPRILEYQVIPGENGRGVRLIVNETLYTGAAAAGALCVATAQDPFIGFPIPVMRPVEIGPFSFKMATELAYCRFLYKDEPPAPLPEKWVPKWVRATLPAAIKIEMAPLEPNPGKLQFLGLTAPIRINRDPMLKYTD
jgi:hypothetical protein